MTDGRARELLMAAFEAAVASAGAEDAVRRNLPAKPKGRCVVVGAGKASAAMAVGLDAAWPDVDVRGAVVVPYGSALPAGRIDVLEASHPVPDDASIRAAYRMMSEVSGLSDDDVVVALISGGGSALLAMPAAGMTLADEQAVNRSLLASGMPIGEMNIIRRHLSAIKGGRLAAAAAPARVVTLLISDVPGDDPAAIASGPTIVDTTSAADARRIVDYYALDLPASAKKALTYATVPAAVAAGDVKIIASPREALAAAASAVRALGATPLILGDAIEGEAREVGTALAGIARSSRDHGHPIAGPCVLLSGGEATVSIGKGPAGRGGRNTELLLSFALAVEDTHGIWALACDTDGIDGTEDAAGAIVSPDTRARAWAKGLDLRRYLSSHDSWSAFNALGDLVVTGPTRTNVNDFRAILVA